MAKHHASKSVITTVLIAVALASSFPLRAEEPFDYFRNSWIVMGLKDSFPMPWEPPTMF